MALSVFLKEPVQIDELLDLARRQNYTNHGEMFSTENLMSLSLNYLPVGNVEIIKSAQLKEQEFVAKEIASGNLLLVPYPFFTKQQ
jgi:hypothetical protein